MMILSNETIKGLKITGSCIYTCIYIVVIIILCTTCLPILCTSIHVVKSFVEISRYLLAALGVNFYYQNDFARIHLRSFLENKGHREEEMTILQFTNS